MAFVRTHLDHLDTMEARASYLVIRVITNSITQLNLLTDVFNENTTEHDRDIPED